jgi:hypothetical protein
MYQVRNERREIVCTVSASSQEHAMAALIRRGYAIVGTDPTFGWIVVK